MSFYGTDSLEGGRDISLTQNNRGRVDNEVELHTPVTAKHEAVNPEHSLRHSTLVEYLLSSGK